MPNDLIKVIKSIMPPRFILGVSMGVDSLAAWAYLKSKKYDFIPVHFHHKCLGNKNADLAAENFRKLGGKYIGYRKDTTSNTESSLREARLEYFHTVSKETGIRNIITAHHLDDWVEGYLLNCFRGKPTNKPFNLVSTFDGFNIIHPFLLSPKQSFIQYLTRTGNTFACEDTTNVIIKGSRRNWVRKVIIPEMEKNQVSLRKYALRSINEQI